MIKLLAQSVCLAFLVSCSVRNTVVQETEVWKTVPQNSSSQHPFPEETLESLQCKKNIGLCFSGGGTVSAMATSGQLRALQKLGLLDQVRYISAVSGGAWGSLPYIFHDSGNSNITATQLLGEFIEPGDLTLKHFPLEDSGHFLGVPTIHAGISLASQMNANAFITKNMLMGGLNRNGDENYARALNRIYLEPLGLSDPSKLFTHDGETLRRALQRNNRLDSSHFYLANSNKTKKPFFIANSYLVKRRSNSAAERLYHLELTPYYSGVRRFDPHTHSLPIGGGLIETYAMDSTPAGFSDGRNRRVKFHRDFYHGVRSEFALSDLLAATGAAPTVPRSFSFLSDALGFPEFRHWSAGDDKSQAGEFLTTDGGAVDNLGIQSLLARGVETVFVFLNNETSFISRGDSDEIVLPDALLTLFGAIPEDQLKSYQKWRAENQVFDGVDLAKVKAKFDAKLKSGNPLIVETNHITRENVIHAVPSGVRVKVVWFVMAGFDGTKPKYNADGLGGINPWTNQTAWWKSLNEDVKGRLEDFKIRTFPLFPTFLATQNNVIALSVEKTEPLAHYTAFQLWSERALIYEIFEVAR